MQKNSSNSKVQKGRFLNIFSKRFKQQSSKQPQKGSKTSVKAKVLLLPKVFESKGPQKNQTTGFNKDPRMDSQSLFPPFFPSILPVLQSCTHGTHSITRHIGHVATVPFRSGLTRVCVSTSPSCGFVRRGSTTSFRYDACRQDANNLPVICGVHRLLSLTARSSLFSVCLRLFP